jgi:hypothetical protein
MIETTNGLLDDALAEVATLVTEVLGPFRVSDADTETSTGPQAADYAKQTQFCRPRLPCRCVPHSGRDR